MNDCKMSKLLVQHLPLQGKRVLVRVDFNVPLLKDGSIADDTRIKEALPTIHYILDQGGSVILMSHMGKPQAKRDLRYSLGICAKKLSQLIPSPVFFASDCIGKEVEKMAHDLKNGQVLLLENLRFHPGEENPEQDPNFARSLASIADFYVNDAFGTAHRKHASTYTIAQFFPQKAALGLLIQKEMSFLNPLVQNPKHPFYALIGGAKISSKLGILHSLLSKVDAFFIGGAMAFTFLKAQGMNMGDSLVEENCTLQAHELLNLCAVKKVALHLPSDIVIASSFSENAEHKVISTTENIPPGWQGMDIGPQTSHEWALSFQQASTLFWNGPVGVFEMPPFAKGTKTLATAISDLNCTKVVGGGDSIAAINSLGIQKKFSHLSTGGGASLEYLEFGTLPGIDAASNRVAF